MVDIAIFLILDYFLGLMFYPSMIAVLRNYLFIFNCYLYNNL